jgi:MerR family mercuric resistance operon transcriptional regulator
MIRVSAGFRGPKVMTLSIGQVAKQAGVEVATVRFYERRGLLSEPVRKDSGYRQYTEDVVGRLCFIKRAKELGFSLKEISELLSLQADPLTTCADVRARGLAKLKDIAGKIRDLEKIQDALERVTAACKGSGPIQQCSILDALNGSRAMAPKGTSSAHRTTRKKGDSHERQTNS